MVVRNITTNKNYGNSNKLLHRLRNLVAIHGLPIAMVVRNITTQQHCGNNFKQQQHCYIWLQEHQAVVTPINTNATKCHHGNILNLQQHFSKKGLLYVSPLTTANVNNAMHYFCGNTIPYLTHFWTNIAKHTPITIQFVVMQIASSGNRAEIQQWKQNSVALSTAEAEYISAGSCA